MPHYQGGQGEDAALATVVRPHHDEQVLDGDDDDQRPEDERQDTQHVGLRRRQVVLAGQRLPEGVQRAGPDVAEHDAERADRQRGLGAVAGGVSVSLADRSVAAPAPPPRSPSAGARSRPALSLLMRRARIAVITASSVGCASGLAMA
jgi:hypothetical protein